MSKYLTTIALLAGGIAPIIADVSNTHLFNPDWDAHARVHEVWRLSTNFLIFLSGMYLLWVKKKEVLAAFLGLCIHLGFVLAAILMPLYGGSAVGEGIAEPTLFGIPVNGFLFSTMLLVQLFALFLIMKNKATS